MNTTDSSTIAASSVALVFPGLGSQQPVTASPWADQPSAVRWAEADEVLGWDVSRLGAQPDAEELREPLNCHIATNVITPEDMETS